MNTFDPFDVNHDPQRMQPIIGTTRPPISRSEDSVGTPEQRARWSQPRVYHQPEPSDEPPRGLEVVMRGPVQRRHITMEQAAIGDAVAARAAPQAIDNSEALAALRVEMAALRELSERQAARIEELEKRSQRRSASS